MATIYTQVHTVIGFIGVLLRAKGKLRRFFTRKKAGKPTNKLGNTVRAVSVLLSRWEEAKPQGYNVRRRYLFHQSIEFGRCLTRTDLPDRASLLLALSESKARQGHIKNRLHETAEN